MKTKILLWSFVLVLTVGMAGDTNLIPKADSPQVIHLDDHTKLTLLGTTFGHHHIAPGYEIALALTAIRTRSLSGLKRSTNQASGRVTNCWFRTGRTQVASTSGDRKGHL